ncbi:MAG: hypothetical protein QW176_08070, partial [Candidatus Bathyarchaeia archaeon]
EGCGGMEFHRIIRFIHVASIFLRRDSPRHPQFLTPLSRLDIEELREPPTPLYMCTERIRRVSFAGPFIYRAPHSFLDRLFNRGLCMCGSGRKTIDIV